MLLRQPKSANPSEMASNNMTKRKCKGRSVHFQSTGIRFNSVVLRYLQVEVVLHLKKTHDIQIHGDKSAF